MKLSFASVLLSIYLIITAYHNNGLVQNYYVAGSILALSLGFIIIPCKPNKYVSKESFRYKWYVYNQKRGNRIW